MSKGEKIPDQQQPVPPEDPNANEAAKAAAADAKSRERRRAGQGTLNKTLATSPEGTLGSAPINQPALKPTLGA